ncbi:hypothetical protein GGX14DRAFT_575480 [Mycena pura]|uniref:Uncharacterized protein n=1 Tax=Mycena pura TaxID=153505 RepID=A0AAD6UZ60_9AGAR|nr:hypothetical protein GGX14DRAFT_575480 [Mycena pura]
MFWAFRNLHLSHLPPAQSLLTILIVDHRRPSRRLQQQLNTPIVRLDTVHRAHGPPPPLPPPPPPSMLNATSG